MSRFLEQLRKRKDDRGMMANLRCILVDNKKHRAWPVLSRLGVAIDDEISSYIAGLYATHPEETDQGNFGDTCKAIQAKRDEKHGEDGKLTATERRFQHLLASGNRAELQSRVRRMVLMAKTHGMPINFERLAADVRRWNDRTKNEWASAFWTHGASRYEEEGS